MDERIEEKHKDLIHQYIEAQKHGTVPPWKLEDELVSKHDISPPLNFTLAAMCRRGFIEDATNEHFAFIQIPEKPYKRLYHCLEDDFVWELDARDDHLECSLCGRTLLPLDQHAPLVSNYVGGSEVYFSYAGRIKVRGDIENIFTNLLVYGTGLGPIGVTRGCHLLNKLGGAEVRVFEFGSAVRCNGYVFGTEELQMRAQRIIENNLAQIRTEMENKLAEFSGRISAVDFERVERDGDFILYVDFVADFENFRGHGAISKAVGSAKNNIESLLHQAGIDYKLSVIAQGHDGDLKPSPNNKRGRRAEAEIRIPIKDFEGLLKVDPEKFLAFIKVDSTGAEHLGCQFYSGMGGEIIPAVYKATQVNPQSPLVSSFQNIYARRVDQDVVYGVELPNIEVGIASSVEGLISPIGREALRMMGIRTAKDFAASLTAQVLAGEFNLALEISREKLYSS